MFRSKRILCALSVAILEAICIYHEDLAFVAGHRINDGFRALRVGFYGRWLFGDLHGVRGQSGLVLGLLGTVIVPLVICFWFWCSDSH